MSVVTLLNQKESLQRIRALGPTIIFCATSLLMVISIFGTVVAFSIFRVQITNANTGASPCLILLSSAVSFVFVGLYLLAARRNEPISKSRPPTQPLHGACFITMRIAALLWTAAMVVAIGTTLNLANCGNSGLCLLQRIDMIISILAIPVATTIILGLENSDTPFKTPSVLNVQPQVVCRVSYFDNFFEENVSRGSSVDFSKTIKRESTLQIPSLQETQIKILIPGSPELPHRNFSDALALLGDPRWLDNLNSYSARANMASKSSCTGNLSVSSLSDESHSRGDGSGMNESLFPENLASHPTQKHLIAPLSNSVSSSLGRSPLSKMRSVENPEIVIQSSPRLFSVPLGSAARDGSVYQSNNSIVASLPMVHVRSSMRKPYAIDRQLDLRKRAIQSRRLNNSHSIDARGSSHNPTPFQRPSSTKRRVSQVDGLSLYSKVSHEDTLVSHTRIIEESIQAAIRIRMLEEQRSWDGVYRQNENHEPEVCLRVKKEEAKNQSSITRVALGKETAGESPVLPELDLDGGVLGMT